MLLSIAQFERDDERIRDKIAYSKSQARKPDVYVDGIVNFGALSAGS